MKKAIFFLTLLSLISCNLLPKQTHQHHYKSNAIPTDSLVKKGVLKNGLTYYIKKNAIPEQKVELRLVVKAGSILENEKQLGLAHFMEHMNFNGSKHFNKNELVDYLQSIGVKFGAHLNAYTSFDETVYILPIPTDDEKKLEKGLQIIEDWAFNASLTEEEIDKERGVVLEEYRIGLGAGKRMLKKYLPKLMYQSRYANRLPIGTKEIIENFSYRDLRDFYKDWYRPNLMSVVVVGDIDTSAIEQKIKTHFSHYKNPKKEKERIYYTGKHHQKTLISICTDKEATRSTVQLFYKDTLPATKINSITDYKEHIVNRVFSEMLNSRLTELKNKENPPFIYAGSWYTSLWDKSQNAYQSYAITSENGQLTALKTLATENERVLQFGFTEDELIRAKKEITSNLEKLFNESETTKSNAYAKEYVQNFLTENPIPGINWEYENTKKILQEINLKDCNSVIKNKIHDYNLVVILTGPEKENLTPITSTQVSSVLLKTKNTKLTPYVDHFSDLGLMKNIKPKPGKIISQKYDSISKSTLLNLSNGAKVTYKKTSFKNDEILFSGFSFGGSSTYNNTEYLKTALANNALKEAGVNGYSKNDLHKILAGKQVTVYPFIGDIEEGVKGNCNNKDLITLFKLTHLYFTKLNYNNAAFTSYKNKILAYYNNALSNPKVFFNKELNEFVNQNNPRFVSFPSQENFDNTDYQLAYNLYQKRFADAGNFHFYFVGNFEEQVLKNYCEQYLASLPQNNSLGTYNKTQNNLLNGVHQKNFVKGSEQQSLVKIIFQGKPNQYKPNEEYYLKSLGELLTIKLVESLRENESGVYGISASGNIEFLPEIKYSFNITFPCGPENTEKLIHSALTQLNNIKNNGVSAKDLNKIKETQALEFKEALKENSFWLNTLKKVDFYSNLTVSNILDHPKRISKLNSDNLKQVANKYLKTNRIIAVLKPEK